MAARKTTTAKKTTAAKTAEAKAAEAEKVTETKAAAPAEETLSVEAEADKKTAKKTTAKKPAAKKTAAKKAEEKPAAKASEKKEEKPAAKVEAKKAEEKPAAKAAEKAEEKPAAKAAEKAEEKPAAKAEAKKAEEKPAAKAAEKAEEKPAAKAEAKKAEEKPAAKAEAKKAEEKPAAKAAAKKAEEKPAAKAEAKKAEEKSAAKAAEKAEEKPAAKAAAEKAEEKPAAKAAEKKEEAKEEKVAEEVIVETAPETQAEDYGPRRSVVFIGSECYPFVKSGGLGDVMYALPKELARQNCDVKVILPRYACIPWEYQEKMVYKGSFDMDLCSDGRRFYVGIMEYVWDGVVYDFIDNQEFFTNGNPYTNLVDDIPKFCYFGKAALAALLYMDWIPDVIHCHDWQAGLVPIYLRTLFDNTKLAGAKTVFTIHNLRFQGIYNIETIQYWSGLPDYVFNKDCLTQNWLDANMLKGGLAYSNMITTVSNTYAGEIQTPFFGEGLDAHLRYHSGKLRGIVNGIDVETWDPATDWRVSVNYGVEDAVQKKKENKAILQEEVGLEKDDGKFVIGLISRLTNQKGLDLINAIIPDLMDGNTQIAVLGTGDSMYENSFRYYENEYKGSVSSSIMYDETRAHKIYAGADALLVPSLFEPCGLTQLNAMRYGTVPIVRETGGLKDTVEPYNQFENTGNGFTFDRYETGLLLDACNRAKTLFFTERDRWDEMLVRDMQKDVSWSKAAKQYKDMYLELTQR